MGTAEPGYDMSLLESALRKTHRPSAPAYIDRAWRSRGR